MEVKTAEPQTIDISVCTLAKVVWPPLNDRIDRRIYTLLSKIYEIRGHEGEDFCTVRNPRPLLVLGFGTSSNEKVPINFMHSFQL
jgi:hypothetical protein